VAWTSLVLVSVGMTPDLVATWLRDSCARQGVPIGVEDPEVLLLVCAVLGLRRGAPGSAAPPRTGDRSDPGVSQCAGAAVFRGVA
jgi:hypothetical protein